MMTSVLNRFEGSDGFLGRLADLAVAREHRTINTWVIQLLNIAPRDRVLEIGFGPGFALNKIAQLVPNGFVAGITSSEELAHYARVRNRTAVQEARMD
jgi:protein-L-isoaspartate O-methyltransferase